MWGIMFNSHLPLELAISGKPFKGEFPMKLNTSFTEPQNFEALKASYAAYFREIMAYCVALNEKNTLAKSQYDPDPFLSALTEDCIDTARDRAYGCRYRTVTVETMALTNTADSLTAVEKLVYTDKKFTLQQLTEAAKANYVGCDTIRSDILACSKYGTDSDTADKNLIWLMELASEVTKAHNHGNVYYCPSLHTLNANVSYGQTLSATLDGRLSGTPTNKNAGPSNSVRRNDPTSLILSAGRLPQYLFNGGQPIDLSFSPSAVENDAEKIAALVRTYASMNGLQMQVNSVDTDTLKKAHESPENYKDVIVRMGGYSCYFTALSASTRLEFIERFEKES